MLVLIGVTVITVMVRVFVRMAVIAVMVLVLVGMSVVTVMMLVLISMSVIAVMVGVLVRVLFLLVGVSNDDGCAEAEGGGDQGDKDRFVRAQHCFLREMVLYSEDKLTGLVAYT